MPQSTLSLARLGAMVGRPVHLDELERLLFASKAEVHAGPGDSVSIEVTPDRLDLLCEGGLGLYLQGALGLVEGAPKAIGGSADPRGIAIVSDPSVAPLRPVIQATVATAPPGMPLDAGLLEEAIRFQELLHATVGSDRRLASLGLYPFDRHRPPYRYTLEAISDVTIVPLDGDRPVPAERFLSSHPLAARYAALGTEGTRLLTLRDAAGAVLSLPPILNARPAGEVVEGATSLLLESTGTRAARVSDALGLMGLVFAARGWRLDPVAVSVPEPEPVPSPRPPGRSLNLSEATLRALSGRSFPAHEVARALARSRVSARAEAGGWSVAVPPWRPDLIAEVDLAEEVILERGIHPEEGQLPPSRTRGRRGWDRGLEDRLTDLLLGAGFTETNTTVLVADPLAARLGRREAIEIAHPVSEQFGHLRDALQISLLGVLEANVRHPYPQRLFEIGSVVCADPTAESGAATRRHAGGVVASERAGFAEAAAWADYLTQAFGATGVREPADLPGTIPGRSARLKIAGEAVAEIGEIAPAVLVGGHLPMPVAWFELDLDRLWPLLGRSGTT
ncbi:MAG TPA: hypothetical protein VGV64_02375 [Thermoplasmata archaeon]|nr:hypothetical protein [Thermoplasmata archaeon]